MPLPSPNKKEKQSDFMNRCVSILSNKGEGDTQEQRIAMCYSQFRKAKAAELVEEFSSNKAEHISEMESEEEEDEEEETDEHEMEEECPNHTTTPMKN